MQNAWNKYGEAAFVFSVLEECDRADLEVREQHYIDMLRSEYNMITKVRQRLGAEPRAKIAAAIRARSALITHCPHGHPYDESNTYSNKKSKHICRKCNALRVAAIYASETPTERKERRDRVSVYYDQNYEKMRVDQNAYAAAHRAEKREYDRQRRLRLIAESLMSEIPL